MKYFLIQGFFYQQQVWIDTAFVGTQGLTPIVREGLISFMYAGAIFHRGHDEKNELVGAMNDEFGHSELRNIVLTDSELSFSKCYETYEIQYVFKKGESNTWVGRFFYPNHPTAREGLTRCVLTPVDWNLFKRDMAKILDDAVGQVGIDFDELTRVESGL